MKRAVGRSFIILLYILVFLILALLVMALQDVSAQTVSVAAPTATPIVNALGKYKFMNFGYWAAIWVHLNRISEHKKPNPWKEIVLQARAHIRSTGE